MKQNFKNFLKKIYFEFKNEKEKYLKRKKWKRKKLLLKKKLRKENKMFFCIFFRMMC